MSTDFTPPIDQHQPRRRLSFDPTINLGHVLTFVGFLITGFSAYSALDKRVTVIESQAAAVVERGREQDVRLKDSLLDIKSDIKDLQRSVNDVNRSLSSVPRVKP